MTWVGEVHCGDSDDVGDDVSYVAVACSWCDVAAVVVVATNCSMMLTHFPRNWMAILEEWNVLAWD